MSIVYTYNRTHIILMACVGPVPDTRSCCCTAHQWQCVDTLKVETTKNVVHSERNATNNPWFRETEMQLYTRTHGHCRSALCRQQPTAHNSTYRQIKIPEKNLLYSAYTCWWCAYIFFRIRCCNFHILFVCFFLLWLLLLLLLFKCTRICVLNLKIK